MLTASVPIYIWHATTIRGIRSGYRSQSAILASFFPITGNVNSLVHAMQCYGVRANSSAADCCYLGESGSVGAACSGWFDSVDSSRTDSLC